MPRLAWFLPLLLAGCAAPPAAPIRAMTFNIRFDNPLDGVNAWPLRRELLFDTVRACDPDILGLQEVLASQGRDLRAALPDYAFIGVGRDDGVEAGEFVPLMFKSRRFELLEDGHFWLSDTPDIPGSRSAGAACPRVATWARLRDRAARGRELLVLNTHFDHVGVAARLAAAQQIAEFLSRGASQPALIMGDFNCPPDSPPYQLLLQSGLTECEPADDAGGTYHGFGGHPKGPRIDWILHSGAFETRAANVDRTHRAGRFPSDHFAVWAVLEWREK